MGQTKQKSERERRRKKEKVSNIKKRKKKKIGYKLYNETKIFKLIQRDVK